MDAAANRIIFNAYTSGLTSLKYVKDDIRSSLVHPLQFCIASLRNGWVFWKNGYKAGGIL